jgi:hypothetical protein
VSYILLTGILLYFFWHWMVHLRRMKEVDDTQKLLSFLQHEGRFYNRQLVICVVALGLAVWSYNNGRPAPQHVDYAPIAKPELRLWDQTGAWDIGFGAVEITLLACSLWALLHSIRVRGQIGLLWSVRSKLGLDMPEYRVRE